MPKKPDSEYEGQPPVTRERLARASSTVTGAHRERAWERRAERKESEAVMSASVVEQMLASIGGLQSVLLAAVNNSVLASISATILGTDNGFKTWDWKENFASIAFSNLSAGELVLQAGPASPSGAPPGRASSGGVIWVPAGYARVVSMRDSAITVYGATGQSFDFVAYTRPQPPAWGPCGQG